MQEQELKVLLIEDNPGDAFLMKFYLEESKVANYQLTHVEELGAGLDLLEKEGFDIILLDLNLPDSFGVETLKKLLDKFPDILVIVLTGLTDESIGIQTVQMGAQDFLIKGKFDGKVLNSSIRYAFERFQLNHKLQSYSNQFEALQDIAGVGYFEMEVSSKEMYWSDSLYKFLKSKKKDKKPTLSELLSLSSNALELEDKIVNMIKDKKDLQADFLLSSPKKKITLKCKLSKPNGANNEKLIGVLQWD